MSGSATDSEKPSDASHRWRRARAMASTKVGDGLSYQAALRWVMGRRFCNAWAARVVQEKSPSRAGVVRAMARSDHWRCVSTPRWVRTSWKVTSSCQRSTNRSRIWPFQDLSRVRRRVGTEQGLSGEGALGVSDQHPANEDGGLAGAVADRRLGGEFHGAGGAVVPGHRGAGPSYIRLRKENFQRRTPRALQWRATVLARLTGWRWRIQGGVQTQSGDQGNGGTGSSGANPARHSCCRPPAPGVGGAASVVRQAHHERGCMTIWRAQSVSFWCWRPCCW